MANLNLKSKIQNLKFLAPYTVYGRSMEPFSQDGEMARSDGRPSSWCRGDVAVLRAPEASRRREMKRVIGLSGECVAWNGQGRIWINGQPLDEPYARFAVAVPGDDDVQQIRLRDDEYFVAGDYRLRSRDSRSYGAVRSEALMERVRACGP